MRIDFVEIGLDEIVGGLKLRNSIKGLHKIIFLTTWVVSYNTLRFFTVNKKYYNFSFIKSLGKIHTYIYIYIYIYM